MQGFEWAESNLGTTTPDELQQRGVNVYFAPNIATERKVVDLAGGRVQFFQPGEERPEHGYYAEFDGLVRYCRETGRPLQETNGLISIQPTGTREAGDPLDHRGD